MSIEDTIGGLRWWVKHNLRVGTPEMDGLLAALDVAAEANWLVKSEERARDEGIVGIDHAIRRRLRAALQALEQTGDSE